MNNRIKINKEHLIFKEIKIIKKASNQTSNIIMTNGTIIKEYFKVKIKMDSKMKKSIKMMIKITLVKSSMDKDQMKNQIFKIIKDTKMINTIGKGKTPIIIMISI